MEMPSKEKQQDTDNSEKDSPADNSRAPAKSRRLRSLDAFRGLTIAIMLLVNNIGHNPDTPRQLLHGGWNGITLADFVFPWFLFCVGVAIPLSAKAFARKGRPAWKYDVKTLQRAVVLVALGCVLSSVSDGRIEFTLGVLQIIGISFLTSALLYDLPAHRRAFVAGMMLVGYWAAIKYMPVPGLGAHHFAEGKNIIDHVNSEFLSALQLEGLPLVIPTSALILIGTLVGDILTHKDIEQRRKTWLMAALGAGLIALAAVWSLSLDFNKPVWTPSYVLMTTGTAVLALSAGYWVMDIKGKWKWAFPLLVFGSNAILAYAAPILFKILILHKLGIHTGGLHKVSIYLVSWWLVFYALYRKKWFFKV